TVSVSVSIPSPSLPVLCRLSLPIFLDYLLPPPYLHSFPTRRSSDLFMLYLSLPDRRHQWWYKILSYLRMNFPKKNLIWSIICTIHELHLIWKILKKKSIRGTIRLMRKWLSGIKKRLKISGDRKSTRLNSSHVSISYAVFCLKKKKKNEVI